MNRSWMTVALVLLLQALMLSSCQGHSDHSGSLRPPLQDLSRKALVLEEQPDGRVIHTFRPAVDFQDELRKLTFSSAYTGVLAPIVLAGGRQRDCDQEQIDCHRECMSRKLPPPHEYIPRGDPRHNQICRDRCLKSYMDCVDAQKVRAERFSSVTDAVDWLKVHRTQILVGTVVVIAAVTFVVVSAGAGIVVLVPLVLMATGEQADGPRFSGALQ